MCSKGGIGTDAPVFERVTEGTWVAQSVKRLTLGFRSRHDLLVHGFKPLVGLCHSVLQCGTCLGFSLPLSAPPLLTLSLSLSLKINKQKRLERKKKRKSSGEKERGVGSRCWAASLQRAAYRRRKGGF